MSRVSVQEAQKALLRFADDIRRYTLDATDMAFGGAKTGRKIYDLGDGFWETIRDEISRMMVQNYNSIRIMNSPAYYAWKQRARETGLSVRVGKDGSTASIKFVRPALRTGTLRERIGRVEVQNRRINVSRISASDIKYKVSLTGLYKNYGRRFADLVKDRTGEDILVLRPHQVVALMEMIVSQIASR